MRAKSIVAAVGVALLVSACTRYVDIVFAQVTVTGNITYATAPDLVSGAPVALKLDLYQPKNDQQTSRPAIVWVHGGGFKAGSKSATTQVATEYAKRGYVTLSINYRLDPGNRCQDVQDGKITDPEELAEETARCLAAITAAQHDSQAVVRWLRANATTYKVDPAKIAMGGFSAGAVTALHVAYRSDDPGDVGDHDGEDSSIQAALAASGCNYFPASIGPGDAPVHLLHAEFDQAVPFECAEDTAALATAAGLVAETLFFYGEATHAKSLYDKYKAQVDTAWTAFLVDELDLV
jgi:acetyl esterase/lipase